MIRTVPGAIALLLAVLSAAASVAAADPHRPSGKAVFLDPAFGGKDPGPVLGEKTFGKEVTLALAKGVYEGLAKRGIPVHVSRRKDVALTGDQRIAKARATGAEVYVALQVSRDSGNCVQVAVPAFLASSSDAGQDAYLMNLLWEKLQKQSGDLAQTVSRNLKGRGVPLCGEVNVRNDTALEKVMLPVVIVDWRAATAGTVPADAAMQRTIASALAEGIGEYSISSPSADRQLR